MSKIVIAELTVTFIFDTDQLGPYHLLKSLCEGRNVKYLIGCTKEGETAVTISRPMYEIVLDAINQASISAGMLSRMVR